MFAPAGRLLRHQGRCARVDRRLRWNCIPKISLYDDLTWRDCHRAVGEQFGRSDQKEFARVHENGHPASAIAKRSPTRSSSRSRWKSTRWSSAQPYRISNAEVNHAPFLLVHWPRFLQVSRVVLGVSLMLAIFQLPAHAREGTTVKHPTFIARYR